MVYPLIPLARTLVLSLVALLALPALVAPATSGEGRADCPTFYLDAVGEVCELPDGLYLGHYADGTPFTTHGPDPAPEDGHDAEMDASEREPRCATDHYQHVLYGYPASGTDNSGKVEETIRTTIRRMNWILNEDALESGNVEADYKMLCDQYGIFRVDTFVVPSTATDFYTVVNAARSAGFRDSKADYTIFYDGDHPGVCGVGHFSRDERLVENNWNNHGGAYGVTYKGCWTGRTAMHENGHNQGAVQVNAPDSDGGAHCTEGRDIMCYPPTNGILLFCPDRIRFDCDHDSYFDAESEPGEWLHTHWNIGSRLNRFIAFGDTDPRPANEAPTADFTVQLDERTVTLDGSASTDPDGDALHHIWSLGDGTTLVGEQVTHTYTDAGRYDIVLTVSDGKGGIHRAKDAIGLAPYVDARVETHGFDGFISCSLAVSPIATADLCDEDGAVQVFPVPFAPGASTTRILVTWGPADNPAGAFTATEMTYGWQRPASGGSGSGPSPLQGEHDVVDGSGTQMHGADGLLEVRASGISGYVRNQAFSVCVEIAYGDAELAEEAECVRWREAVRPS